MKHHNIFSNRKNLHKKGFSLVELLVTLVVGMLVISAAVSVTIASNRMFRVDRARTRMNQNLRAASDLVGADVRTAGSAVPAVSGDGDDREAGLQPIIVRNGNELEIRRSVLPIALPVCDSVSGGKGVVKVGNPGGSTKYDDEECDDEKRDIDGDGTPDDLEEWMAYRTDTDINPDGTALVYIWPSDDGKGNGEFFTYDDEDMSKQQIHKASGSWEHSYDWEEDKPNLYIMEQRRYRLNEGVLELIINDDEENPLRLVNNITDFQVRVITKDGEFEDFGSEDDHLFSDIQGIKIDVSAEEQVTPGQLVTRELNNIFFPRNAINF